MGDRVTESWQSGMDDVAADRGTDADVRADLAFSETYPAVPESIAAMRVTIGRLAAQAGAPPSTVEGVKLAVSEAATNVVVHAYHEANQPGFIHLEAAVEAGELRVSVADSGPGIRPHDDSPGLGLGLAIIGQLADHVELLQGGTGLHVLMRFAVPESATGS